jgi:hypothetical protein
VQQMQLKSLLSIIKKTLFVTQALDFKLVKLYLFGKFLEIVIEISENWFFYD